MTCSVYRTSDKNTFLCEVTKRLGKGFVRTGIQRKTFGTFFFQLLFLIIGAWLQMHENYFDEI